MGKVSLNSKRKRNNAGSTIVIVLIDDLICVDSCNTDYDYYYD